MPDTTNRPTPEQVLDEPTSGAASWALAALAEHGYVVIHPDDSDGSADIDGQTYLLFDVRAFGDDQ